MKASESNYKINKYPYKDLKFFNLLIWVYYFFNEFSTNLYLFKVILS